MGNCVARPSSRGDVVLVAPARATSLARDADADARGDAAAAERPAQPPAMSSIIRPKSGFDRYRDATGPRLRDMFPELEPYHLQAKLRALWAEEHIAPWYVADYDTPATADTMARAYVEAIVCGKAERVVGSLAAPSTRALCAQRGKQRACDDAFGRPESYLRLEN